MKLDSGQVAFFDRCIVDGGVFDFATGKCRSAVDFVSSGDETPRRTGCVTIRRSDRIGRDTVGRAPVAAGSLTRLSLVATFHTVAKRLNGVGTGGTHGCWRLMVSFTNVNRNGRSRHRNGSCAAVYRRASSRPLAAGSGGFRTRSGISNNLPRIVVVVPDGFVFDGAVCPIGCFPRWCRWRNPDLQNPLRRRLHDWIWKAANHTRRHCDHVFHGGL